MRANSAIEDPVAEEQTAGSDSMTTHLDLSSPSARIRVETGKFFDEHIGGFETAGRGVQPPDREVAVGTVTEPTAESPQLTRPGGVVLSQPSGSASESRDEQRRLRRLFVTIRSFLQAAEEAEDEREVVMTVVQAAAIWYEIDARAYRRDLQGRFKLDVWLPGADLTVGPRDFSAFSVVSGPVTRISAIGEQEQLGWHDLSGELVLLPIVARSQAQPWWILAIRLETDATVSPNLLLLCEVLGLCLDRLAARRAQELRKRLVRILIERDDRVPHLANAALAQVVSFLGAAQGRLITDAGEGEAESRTMAADGGEWTAGPTPRLEPGQSEMTPRRLTMAFSVGNRATATIDLAASEESEFGVSQALLLETAVAVIRTWLAGVLDGIAAAPPAEAEPSKGFELRIGEELARAKRVDVPTGLLTIDLAPGPPGAVARTSMPIPDVVVRQLRSSDVIGRLEGGEICVLLGHTGGEGTAAAARRLLDSLRTLAEEHKLPRVSLGATTFVATDASAEEVVARARQDATTREGGD